MKYIRKIVTLMLALMLGVLPLCAPCAMAESDFSKNEWVVLRPDEVFYKDAALTKEWVKAPYYVMVKLAAIRGDVAAVVHGKKVAYISLKNATHLKAGDSIVTAKKTYAFQKPSTKSKYVKLKKNVVLELKAVKGDCAMVTKNGVTAYVNMKHCEFVPASRNNEKS